MSKTNWNKLVSDIKNVNPDKIDYDKFLNDKEYRYGIIGTLPDIQINILFKNFHKVQYIHDSNHKYGYCYIISKSKKHNIQIVNRQARRYFTRSGCLSAINTYFESLEPCVDFWENGNTYDAYNILSFKIIKRNFKTDWYYSNILEPQISTAKQIFWKLIQHKYNVSNKDFCKCKAKLI
ncbi:MAG: hypothetical protein ACM3O3_12955 [Syntrophothermus sp.]